MLNKFANYILPKLEDWCVAKGKYHIIKGRPGTDTADSPYLIRHFLFCSKYLCIYLHRFMRSDERAPHDHNFPFVTYIVKGGYTERMWNWFYQGEHGAILDEETEAYRPQGSIWYRPYTTTHMVSIPRSYELHEKKDAPMTIVFRGPLVREWAFYVERAREGVLKVYDRVQWDKYLGVKGQKKEFE